ncbi:MAG: hypothetical protein EOP50_13410, partial [Sphingobacteriales bacterium]
MKQILFLLTVLSLPFAGRSQAGLYNNGSNIYIGSGTVLTVEGALVQTSGSSLVNNGTLRLAGDLTNNATMGNASGGTLIFNGSTAQQVSGSAPFFATNVTLQNGAGITLSNGLW